MQGLVGTLKIVDEAADWAVKQWYHFILYFTNLLTDVNIIAIVVGLFCFVREHKQKFGGCNLANYH